MLLSNKELEYNFKIYFTINFINNDMNKKLVFYNMIK